jgi:2-aminoethylphosphonate-pyruvate transaminase
MENTEQSSGTRPLEGNLEMASEPNFSTMHPLPAPAMGEPYLLTPGPLTTAIEVKQAMLRDWGSWDGDFRAMTADLRRRLLALLGEGSEDFDCVPLQGSGTFCVEAMLGSFVPRDGKVLVLANGAYGLRAAETLKYLGREFMLIDKGDYLPPRGDEVGVALDADPAITHVIAIHCETSSGILNPVAEISQATYARGRKLLIDSMSAFGAVPLGVRDIRYEAMVSSANKCIEGVPGFGFVIARKSELEAAVGRSHSLSLDVHAQWAYMNKTGQWRFTPPTHVVAAFLKALEMHEFEGGVAGRGARYASNRDVLVAGMRELGFETLLDDNWLSPIIVTFFNPAHAGFAFNTFYDLMKARGFIIYPGKLTVVDSFRVGCIGRMDEHVMRRVVAAAGECLAEMGVDSAAPPPAAIAERARLAA